MPSLLPHAGIGLITLFLLAACGQGQANDLGDQVSYLSPGVVTFRAKDHAKATLEWPSYESTSNGGRRNHKKDYDATQIVADDFVAEHNAWRREVRAQPLQWNADLAKVAQEWVKESDRCMLVSVTSEPNAVHKLTNMTHGVKSINANMTKQRAIFTAAGLATHIAAGQIVGENVLIQNRSRDGRAVVANWMKEKANYTYGPENNDCTTASAMNVHHYTQGVWSPSTAVGCARASCPFSLDMVWVCLYWPPKQNWSLPFCANGSAAASFGTAPCANTTAVAPSCAPSSSTTCGAKFTPSTCCSCEQDDHTQDICGALNCPANSMCTYMGNKVNATLIQSYNFSFNTSLVQCTCDTGFQKSASNLCVDINECLSANNTCNKSVPAALATCRNTVGSYECTCPTGYLAKDAHARAHNRLANDSFYTDNTLCFDENECTSQNKCNGTQPNIATCNNTAGSFTCSCISGYYLKDKHMSMYGLLPTDSTYTTNLCYDVDECNAAEPDVCKQVLDVKPPTVPFPQSIKVGACNNTAGSYQCYCEAGFNRSNNTCVDINECNSNTICNATNDLCKNTYGGFECGCKAGFARLTPTGACQNINECDAANPRHTCATNSYCNDTVGSFSCVCNSGYIKKSVRQACLNETLTTVDADQCVDDNECLLCANVSRNVGLCSSNATCWNMEGSYKCACAGGGLGTGTRAQGCSNISYCDKERLPDTLPSTLVPLCTGCNVGCSSPPQGLTCVNDMSLTITLDECKKKCAEVTTCSGIEYDSATGAAIKCKLAFEESFSVNAVQDTNTKKQAWVKVASPAPAFAELSDKNTINTEVLKRQYRMCSSNSLCNRTSSKCECSTGYRGSGRVCVSSTSDDATLQEAILCTGQGVYLNKTKTHGWQLSDCLCKEGYSGSNSGCTTCNFGEYAPAASQTCKTCPPNSVSLPGSTSLDNCKCARNFYKDTTTPVTNDTCRRSGGNVTNPCMACPANSETAAIGATAMSECVCKKGFEKAGPDNDFYCAPVDLCAKPDTCSANSICTNNHITQTSSCACNTVGGYVNAPEQGGFCVKIFLLKDDVVKLPVLTGITPDFAGTTTSLKFSGSEFFTSIGATSQAVQKMAVEIKGNIVVTTAGNYVFYVNSSDGSKVTIGAITVDNDGMHAPLEKQNDPANLDDGTHQITVTYFAAKPATPMLNVMYSGPDTGDDGIKKPITSASSGVCKITEDANKPDCFAVSPIDGCSIVMDGAARNVSVNLTLAFKVKTPVKKGDYIEFGLSGFTAGSTQNVVPTISAKVTPGPAVTTTTTGAAPKYQVFEMNATKLANPANKTNGSCYVSFVAGKRPLGGGKCNSYRDAPKLVGSVDACAYYANSQTNVTGFCVEEGSCYVSTNLDTDLQAVPVSTRCESGKGKTGAMSCYRLAASGTRRLLSWEGYEYAGYNSWSDFDSSYTYRRDGEAAAARDVQVSVKWIEETETLNITVNESLDAGHKFELKFDKSKFPLRTPIYGLGLNSKSITVMSSTDKRDISPGLKKMGICTNARIEPPAAEIKELDPREAKPVEVMGANLEFPANLFGSRVSISISVQGFDAAATPLSENQKPAGAVLSMPKPRNVFFLKAITIKLKIAKWVLALLKSIQNGRRELADGEFVLDEEEQADVYLHGGQLTWRGKKLLQAGSRSEYKVQQAAYDQATASWIAYSSSRRQVGDVQVGSLPKETSNSPGYSGQISNLLTVRQAPILTSSPSSPASSSPVLPTSGGGGGGGSAAAAGPLVVTGGFATVSPSVATLLLAAGSSAGVLFAKDTFGSAVDVSVEVKDFASYGISLASGVSARSKVLSVATAGKALKPVTVQLDVIPKTRRQDSQVRLHHLDKLDGSWKAVCSSTPTVSQGLGKQELPASILNGPSFNPSKDCKTAALCDGKGGLLAFLEAPSTVCSSAGRDIQADGGGGGGGIGPGGIAGAVIGSVFGALLLVVLTVLIYRNQNRAESAPQAKKAEEKVASSPSKQQADMVYSSNQPVAITSFKPAQPPAPPATNPSSPSGSIDPYMARAGTITQGPGSLNRPSSSKPGSPPPAPMPPSFPAPPVMSYPQMFPFGAQQSYSSNARF